MKRDPFPGTFNVVKSRLYGIDDKQRTVLYTGSHHECDQYIQTHYKAADIASGYHSAYWHYDYYDQGTHWRIDICKAPD